MSGSEITFPPAVPQSAPVSLSFPSSEGFIFYTPLTQDWGTVIKLGFESEHPFMQIWECILAQGDQCPRPQTFSSVYRGMYSEKLGKIYQFYTVVRERCIDKYGTLQKCSHHPWANVVAHRFFYLDDRIRVLFSLLDFGQFSLYSLLDLSTSIQWYSLHIGQQELLFHPSNQRQRKNTWSIYQCPTRNLSYTLVILLKWLFIIR